jgi:DNA-directed RNA polymerase specialized sigma24 family protein
MFDHLVHEWDRWARSVRGAHTLSRWAIDDHALRGWSTSELSTPRSSPRTDAMQAALVRRAQDGERGAFLALVTQLRPGLTSIVRRARADPGLGTGSETEDEVLATFGEVLMAHDLARRPHRIAANLLLDTRQRLWRSRERRARVEGALRRGVGAGPPPRPTQPEERAVELDLTGAVSTAIQHLAGNDRSRRLTAEAAYRAWFLDQPCDQIAAELGMGHEAVRTRLCRLRSSVRRLHPAA